MEAPPARLTRRALLVGAAAAGAAGAVAACGGPGAKTSTASSDSGAAGGPPTLIAFFPQQGGVLRAGIPQRLVFGLGAADGSLAATGPAELSFTVRSTPVASAGAAQVVNAQRRSQGLPRGYYPVTVNVASPGNYQASAEVGGKPATAAFRIDDPAAVTIPQIGDPMPRIETPTAADPQGVDPICTRDPQCPLHTVSLTTALQQQKPIALLMSTPAFCQVGICGPVLDVLLGQQAEFGGRVQMIHAEVYRSGVQAAKDPGNAPLAPALEAFRLPFEPCLVLAKPDGSIAERLDNIFDAGELHQSLSRLVG